MKKKILILGLIVASCFIAVCYVMDMLIIGISIVILSLVCAMLIMFANKLVKRTNWYRNVPLDANNFPTNDWYREHEERNYNMVVLGSSSAKYAFDFDGIDIKVFNWADQPQSLDYSFRILKNFFSILEKNGKVVISLSPLSGLNVIGKWSKCANDKYYVLLDSTLIDNYNEVSKRRRFPLLYTPKEAIKRLLKDVPAKTNTVWTRSDTIDFEKDASVWVHNWFKEFNIQNAEEDLSTENKQGRAYRVKLLQSMIDFCLERDLKPVLVIPPIHHALANKFTPVFRENYIYSFIKEANIKNIPFYDYMDDSRFSDDKYYMNSFFMSEEGAKKFTRIILNDLQ